MQYLDLSGGGCQILAGKPDKGSSSGGQPGPGVERRYEDRSVSCFYQYLVMEVEKKPGQLEALLRLLHNHTDDSGKHFLFCPAAKLDDSLYDNSGAAGSDERLFSGRLLQPLPLH